MSSIIQLWQESLINEQYNLSSSQINGNLHTKSAWKPQLRFRSHTTRRQAVCSHRSVLEAPRIDPQSQLDGEPQDETSIFTSHGREEVLTTIKSA
jgi:hypothetical protein